MKKLLVLLLVAVLPSWGAGNIENKYGSNNQRELYR